MNEACEMDCSGTISVITEPDKADTIEASLNQLIDGNSDLVMDTIEESITYYGGISSFPFFGALLIVAIIVVCFSFINLVNTTITNFLSRRQEIGMLQAIGLSKKQLMKMLCYEGMLYSAFATLVTLLLGAGLWFSMRTGSENNESIFRLFIPLAGYLAIFGNPADGAVYLDFLYNGESEKTISC